MTIEKTQEKLPHRRDDLACKTDFQNKRVSRRREKFKQIVFLFFQISLESAGLRTVAPERERAEGQGFGLFPQGQLQGDVPDSRGVSGDTPEPLEICLWCQ